MICSCFLFAHQATAPLESEPKTLAYSWQEIRYTTESFRSPRFPQSVQSVLYIYADWAALELHVCMFVG